MVFLVRQCGLVALVGVLLAPAGCAQQREINTLRIESLECAVAVQQLQTELADREHTLEQFQLAMQAAEAIIRDLRREIAGFEEDRNETAKRQAEAGERLNQAMQQLATYERQLADARQDLERLRQTLAGLQPPTGSDPDLSAGGDTATEASHE